MIRAECGSELHFGVSQKSEEWKLGAWSGDCDVARGLAQVVDDPVGFVQLAGELGNPLVGRLDHFANEKCRVPCDVLGFTTPARSRRRISLGPEAAWENADPVPLKV